GLVEIMVPADHTFFEDELRTLRLMAGQAAAATAGARLHADNVHHIGRLQLLAQMTPGLLVHEHEEPLLADAVERLSQLLEAGVCSIYRVDQGLQVLTHVGSRCATVAGLPATPVPISANPHAGLLAYVAATGDTLCFVGGQHRHHPAWDGLALSPASAPGAG